MKLIHLFFIALLIFPVISAKIAEDQPLNALTEAITAGSIDADSDAPANVTKQTCFHADIDAMCLNKTGSASSCDCEQHPENQFALVCCNVTDINKAVSCAGSNISQYQHIHMINANLEEMNLSQLNVVKQVDSLVVTDGNISRISGEFSRFYQIKCLNFSNNNITDISERGLHNLNQLQVLDLSSNNLTRLPSLPNQPSVDIRGNWRIPCANVSVAIERGVNFLYKEASKCEIPTIYNWFNSTATILILEYEKKNQLKADCPENCKCEGDVMIYSKLEGGENNLVLPSKVDCSNLGLSRLPEKLPDNTISLNVSNNSITALSAVVDNPYYQKIGNLFANDNLITSIEELDGSKFWENFTQLSLKNNRIKKIPLYVLANLEKNLNGKLIYLGGNRIHCDCSTAKNERAWRFVQDYDKILCDGMEEKINELKEETVCKSGYHDWARMLDYLIIVEVILLVALISKVSYDCFEVEKQYGAFYTGGTVRWTLDGSQFLCCDDNKVNVISIKTLEIERSIGLDESSPEDAIYTFLLVSNEKFLVTAHRSGLLKLWNFETGELTRSWKNLHTGPVSCLEYSPNLDLLLSGGADSFIRIWDFNQQVSKGSLRGTQGVVSVVKFHPTENFAVGVGDDATIYAWNLETREIVKKFEGHISKVTSISFTSDGRFFVSSSRDKVLILWDFDGGKSVRTVPVYEGIECVLTLPYNLQLPNGLELNDDSKVYVASAGEEGIVKIWQINDSKMLYKQEKSLISRASEEGGLAITQMLYNDHFQQIALVSFDHNIIVHDLSTFACRKQLIGFTDEILDLTLMGKKDQFLVMATNSNDIKVYDTATMNSIILKGHTDIVLALASHKNFLLSSGKDNSVRLWEVNFDDFTFTCIAIAMKHTKAVGSVDFSKVSGNFFASVSQDQCLKLWNIPKDIEELSESEKLQCVNTQLAHEKDINCVTISPNDRYIATSSQDKTAKLWDSKDLKLIGVFRGHRRGVWSVRFSPVDQIIVTNAADCTIRLWNLTDMTCLKSFEGHECSVLRVEFVSNGMQLVSAGADGLLKLWTIKTSECVQTLECHESRVWTMAVTRDETTIFTGGSDSKLVKWRDVTETKKREEIEKRQEEVLQEQELNNLLAQKKMLKALRLALNLNRPYMTLKIINSVIRSQEEGLEETILKLSDDHKQALLQHAVNWNTNSKNCRPAQLVFNVLLQEILGGKYQVQGLGKIIEESMPYSDRHFKRMTEYLKDLKFVEYTMKLMQPYGDVVMK